MSKSYPGFLGAIDRHNRHDRQKDHKRRNRTFTPAAPYCNVPFDVGQSGAKEEGRNEMIGSRTNDSLRLKRCAGNV
jgi:hypothetical protein